MVLNWILVLGGCGLVAGIVGPIRLNPQFQMGPLIGVFITGPLGVVLGLAGYFVSRWLVVSISMQWRIIGATAVLLVGATIVASFPGPEFKAYIVDSVVEQCKPSSSALAEVLAHWQERIEQTAVATTDTNWRESITSALNADTGVIVDARITRRTEIRIYRKPWNRGKFLATDKTKADERTSYYEATGSCQQYAAGTSLQTMIDYKNIRYVPITEEWPPATVEGFILRLPIKPVLPEYQTLIRRAPQ